jgi:hypothetical protein
VEQLVEKGWLTFNVGEAALVGGLLLMMVRVRLRLRVRVRVRVRDRVRVRL